MEVPTAGHKNEFWSGNDKNKNQTLRQTIDSPQFPRDGEGETERIAGGTCPAWEVCGHTLCPVLSLTHRARYLPACAERHRSGSRSSACVRPTGSSRSPPRPCPPPWTGGRGWTSPGSPRHGQWVWDANLSRRLYRERPNSPLCNLLVLSAERGRGQHLKPSTEHFRNVAHQPKLSKHQTLIWFVVILRSKVAELTSVLRQQQQMTVQHWPPVSFWMKELETWLLDEYLAVGVLQQKLRAIHSVSDFFSPRLFIAILRGFLCFVEK